MPRNITDGRTAEALSVKLLFESKELGGSLAGTECLLRGWIDKTVKRPTGWTRTDPEGPFRICSEFWMEK